LTVLNLKRPANERWLTCGQNTKTHVGGKSRHPVSLWSVGIDKELFILKCGRSVPTQRWRISSNSKHLKKIPLMMFWRMARNF